VEEVSIFLFHLRPRSVARAHFARDRRFRRILRGYLAAGARVAAAEIAEFLCRTRFVVPGDTVEAETVVVREPLFSLTPRNDGPKRSWRSSASR